MGAWVMHIFLLRTYCKRSLSMLLLLLLLHYENRKQLLIFAPAHNIMVVVVVIVFVVSGICLQCIHANIYFSLNIFCFVFLVLLFLAFRLELMQNSNRSISSNSSFQIFCLSLCSKPGTLVLLKAWAALSQCYSVLPLCVFNLSFV